MIAIIQYNAGNIGSVQNALSRMGADFVVTDNESDIRSADKVIFPGVGEAGSAMSYLKERGLDSLIISLNQPVLGICLGMQLMCAHSEEGNTPCMGIFNVGVKHFPPDDIVPHMGWNEYEPVHGSFLDFPASDRNVYFVHSYCAEISEHSAATCDYIMPFSAALQRDNFFATQFHPEKSAAIGRTILKNFLEL